MAFQVKHLHIQQHRWTEMPLNTPVNDISAETDACNGV